MKVCVALALLGTPCLTGVAANAQYYYGPAIALGINGGMIAAQAPYAYLPPVYYQAPPIVVPPLAYSQFQFYSRYNQWAYPPYYGPWYGY